MKSQYIITEIHKPVGLVRLERPQAWNAVNVEMLSALVEALEAFDADPSIGAMVITGNERAFAAGADVKEMADKSSYQLLSSDFIATFHRMRAIKKPVIAAVSGLCLGGGNEIALACDMIVASETAKFGQPEITLGIMPGAGGTQRLTHILGKPLAMEMILNNRFLRAEEALQHGLVNRVVPVDKYLDEAMALAKEVAGRAPWAVRLAKETINQALELPFSQGLEAEERAFYLLFASQDQKEGMRAFIDKRPPSWTGA